MPRLVDALEQLFDAEGNPLINGQIDFFESGSSTVRKTTYADLEETIPNANPVIIGGDGRAPNIFGSGTYRLILRQSTGEQILARDPVGGDQALAFGSEWSSDIIYSTADVVREDGRYWESLTDGNGGNRPSTDGGVNWVELPFKDITQNTADIATNTANILVNTTSRENLITGSGQTPSGDLQQEHRAVVQYSADGDFFEDSGAADAYVLSALTGKGSPTSYRDGMVVRFIADNPNTGASTVNLAGLGVKNIKLSGGDDPLAADITGRTTLTFDSANDWFELELEPNITNYFESAEQTLTSGGALTIAHGLGGIPRFYACRVICQTAEFNYSVGDELVVYPSFDDDGGVMRGFSLVVDATNLNIRFGNAASVYTAPNKSTGGREGLVNGNWTLVIRAWL